MEYYVATWPWVRHSGLGLDGPQTLQEVCDAVPKNMALREMLMQALEHFLAKRVAVMRRRQFVFNGQGIRHDGNYGVAKRIWSPKKYKLPKKTVVIAFCGVDGSLLEPVVAKETEAWADIESVLKPLLKDM